MSVLKSDWFYIGFSFALVCLSYAIDVSWIRTAVLLVAYLAVGHEILLKGAKNLKNIFRLDENFLMSVASIAAFSIGEDVEAVAILLFYRIGEAFENYSVARSRRCIVSLMDIAPNYANVKRDKVIQVSPQDVKVGEIIIVKPGEKVPLDGVIISGETSVDTASITGESFPRELSVGDKILSGFINLNGVIEVKTIDEFENSTISKILDMVENATAKKSKSERFITKFARIYTPIVVFSALLLATIAPLFGGVFSEWLYRAIIFLVVSCPCALVVSVPLSFFGGIGGASKNGILIKGSNYIETLSKLGAVAFDKTGTLSKGEFVVKNVVALNGFSTNDVLKFAALAEKNSLHPIAKSIVNAYSGLADSVVSDVSEMAGLGVKAKIDDKNVLVGSAKFIKNFNPTNISETAIHVVIDDVYAGYIVLMDELRSESKACVSALKNSGIKTAMLTGDRTSNAKNVGEMLGLDEIYSELLPDEKVKSLEILIAKMPKNKSMAYIGDGINDAPVLARADVGIAMLGTDTAMETADVVLMHNNLSKLQTAIKISKKTMCIAKFNIAFSIGVKIAILLLAVAGFASIPLAIFGDVGVTVIAVLNALRAFKV